MLRGIGLPRRGSGGILQKFWRVSGVVIPKNEHFFIWFTISADKYATLKEIFLYRRVAKARATMDLIANFSQLNKSKLNFVKF